jgi:hypothetical protein
MTPRDRWKEIDVILNSAIPKEESEKLVALLRESVQYEVMKSIKEYDKELSRALSG